MALLSVGRRTSDPPAVDLAEVLGLDGPGPRARVHTLRRGTWAPDRATARLPLLLVDGALLNLVTARGREGADLAGPGDLIGAESDVDGFGIRRRVLLPGGYVVVDARLLAAAAGQPAIASALAEAAMRRAGVLAGQVVLAQLVAIDDRLRILLPSLAERWGKVTSDGIVLPSFLSHTVLSALVGARRPSLTAAVGRLVEDGSVRRLPDRRWLLPNGLDGIG